VNFAWVLYISRANVSQAEAFGMITFPKRRIGRDCRQPARNRAIKTFEAM
jgi:hypothetical protein